MDIKVGVLALQGAFREHLKAVMKCGVYAEEIKLPDEKEVKSLLELALEGENSEKN